MAAAKVAVGNHGRFVGQAVVQTHRGMGLTHERRVGHYFKRVTMLDSTFGNMDYHLKRYTALSAAAA